MASVGTRKVDQKVDMDVEVEPLKNHHQLDPHQRKIYSDMVKRLGLIPGYDGLTSNLIMNNSSMGTGKTDVTCAQVALIDPDYVIIIGPSNSEGAWKRTLPEYNLDERSMFFSYGSITPKANGTSGANLLEGFGPYQNTKFFKDILKHSVVLVFDECHYIKNADSGRTKAAQKIENSIKKGDERNRIIYLSGTPNDKPEMKFVTLYHLGVMKYPKTYTVNRQGMAFGEFEYKTDGLTSIKTWIEQRQYYLDIEGIEYNNILYDLEEVIKAPTKKSAEEICELVYDKIVNPLLVFSMPNMKKTKNLAYTLIGKSFCNKTEIKNIEAILKEKEKLDKKAEKAEETGKGVGKGFMAQMQKLLKEVEIEKAPLSARIADKVLKRSDKLNRNRKKEDRQYHKIVIQMNFYEAIDKLTAEFEKLGYDLDDICMYVGQVKIKGKKKVLSSANREKERLKFQAPDRKHRIIILSEVGNASIDLDDQSEDRRYPRVLLGPTSYKTTNQAQLFGRVFRNNTTTDSVTILILYSFAEQLMKRHLEKSKTLTKGTREGSIPITDRTPYVEYDFDTDRCTMFTVKPDTTEYDKTVCEDFELAMFDERAYQQYLITNPIDLTDCNTPQEPSLIKVEVEYESKKKTKKDTILIGTDLSVDTKVLMSMDQEELLDHIYVFYDQEGLSKRKLTKVINVEKMSELKEDEYIDYYFPGYRRVNDEEEEEEEDE